MRDQDEAPTRPGRASARRLLRRRWSSAERCLGVALLTIPWPIVNVGVIDSVLARPEEAPFLDPDFLPFFRDSQVFFAVAWTCMAVVSELVRRRGLESRLLVHTTAQLFSLGNALLVYMTGSLTSPASISFVGSTLIAALLFGIGPAFGACASAATLIALTTAGELLGWLEYAPLLADAPFEDGMLAPWWRSNLGGTAVAYLAVTLALLAVILTRGDRHERALTVAYRELEARDHRYRDLLESTGDLMLSLDPGGLVGYANRAWCDATGTRPHEVVGRPLLDRIEPERREAFRDALARALAEPGAVGIDTAFRGRDAMVEASGTLSTYREEGRPAWVRCLLRDTSRSRMLDEMKKQFVTNVNHELRTPLTELRGAVKIMARTSASGGDPVLMGLASRAIDRLCRVVEGIVDLERLETGRRYLNARPCLLTEVIGRALARTEEEGLELSRVRWDPGRSGVDLVVDSDELAAVLAELLDNAGKFSGSEDEIAIDVVEESDRVRIDITDRGIGIPEGASELVFGTFSQVDGSSTRKNGGLGLGLALARARTSQLGGTIDYAENPDGGGTTFQLSLPRVPPGYGPEALDPEALDPEALDKAG